MRFGIEWFRGGVLALLLEFFVIHAGGFMAVVMYDPETAPRTRSRKTPNAGSPERSPRRTTGLTK